MHFRVENKLGERGSMGVKIIVAYMIIWDLRIKFYRI